jgi:hypothetical protein
MKLGEFEDIPTSRIPHISQRGRASEYVDMRAVQKVDKI